MSQELLEQPSTETTGVTRVDSETTDDQKDVASKTKQSNSQKSKKRKRGKGTKAEQVLAVKQERYDKLLYTARKQLNKQAKQLKTFVVQKNIRKLKNNNNNNNNNSNGGNTSEDAKFQNLKDLSMDLVVNQAVRQLGLIHANPNPDDCSPGVTTNNNSTEEEQSLVSMILDHKRFQSALEEWNEKVADFRRFCLRLDERDDRFVQDSVPDGRRKPKKGGQPNKEQQDLPTSLFCSLNGEERADEMEMDPNDKMMKKMMPYGPAALYGDEPVKKKNRQGQRARRAKALAIEAKKEGRRVFHSTNWRSADEKPQPQREDGRRRRDRDRPSSAPRNVESSAPPKAAPPPEIAPAEAHPSWAAKQQQKTNIVAFQGTKITFD